MFWKHVLNYMFLTRYFFTWTKEFYPAALDILRCMCLIHIHINPAIIAKCLSLKITRFKRKFILALQNDINEMFLGIPQESYIAHEF